MRAVLFAVISADVTQTVFVGFDSVCPKLTLRQLACPVNPSIIGMFSGGRWVPRLLIPILKVLFALYGRVNENTGSEKEFPSR